MVYGKRLDTSSAWDVAHSDGRSKNVFCNDQVFVLVIVLTTPNLAMGIARRGGRRASGISAKPVFVFLPLLTYCAMRPKK